MPAEAVPAGWTPAPLFRGDQLRGGDGGQGSPRILLALHGDPTFHPAGLLQAEIWLLIVKSGFPFMP